MVTAYKNGSMAHDMKVSGKITELMARENLYTLMVMFMKATG